MLRPMFFLFVLLATSNYSAEAQVFKRGRILSFNITRSQPASQQCPQCMQNTAQERLPFSVTNSQSQFSSYAVQNPSPVTFEYPVQQFPTWPVDMVYGQGSTQLFATPFQNLGGLAPYISDNTNPVATSGNSYVIQDPSGPSGFDVYGQRLPVLQPQITTSDPVSPLSGSNTGQSVFTEPPMTTAFSPVDMVYGQGSTQLFATPFQNLGGLAPYISDNTNPVATSGNSYVIQDPSGPSGFDVYGQRLPVLQPQITTSDPVSPLSGSNTGQSVFTEPPMTTAFSPHNSGAEIEKSAAPAGVSSATNIEVITIPPTLADEAAPGPADADSATVPGSVNSILQSIEDK